VWFNEKLLLRRRATEVDLDPRLSKRDMKVGDATVPIEFGGGAVRKIDASTPGAVYALDRAPKGFTYDGRYAVAPSAPPTSNGTPSGNRRSSFVDVWTNGADVLLLDQGGLAFAGDALGPNDLAHDVDLGALGRGRSAPGARFSQVAISKKDGTYVRLIGTLPVDRLVPLMRTVRRVSSS